MTISSIFLERPDNQTVGLWGTPTSSVNWCETDYTISYYVAEFFNSMTSMCMVGFALLGQWSLRYLSKNINSKSNPKRDIYDPLLAHPSLLGVDRVWFTWFALQIVGWGSVAFHGSLQWWSQAFDEIPMVWCATIHLTTCLVARYDPLPLASSSGTKVGSLMRLFIPSLRRDSKGEPYAPIISTIFFIYAIACSLLVSLFRGPSQFLMFHILFGSVQFSGFFCTWAVSSKVLKESYEGVAYIKDSYSEAEYKYLQQKHKDDISRLHRLGLTLYILAIIIWSLDLNLCDWMSNIPIVYPDLDSLLSGAGIKWVQTTFNPQGHAWWHFLVSSGFYHLGTMAAYDRILIAHRVFWEGVEKKDKGCLELLAANKVNGREVARKGDVPVIKWIGGVVPVIAIWREQR
ncbi:hypothetical protein H072_9836 [Dactylellina haptotyla CBS 200.50]|uniref:Alkaline ceramidase 3 n=1 Tax=Dactylellina haptotyla (strain CBS 200.50) TaxID=1284197 RepID=S8A655_DACHA|nr:hypothetical protein H072_9836 [Dactylellina haptotyla CBS 200.50]